MVTRPDESQVSVAFLPPQANSAFHCAAQLPATIVAQPLSHADSLGGPDGHFAATAAGHTAAQSELPEGAPELLLLHAASQSTATPITDSSRKVIL